MTESDTRPLKYPSEKNVSRHGAIAVGASVRITLRTELMLLGRGVPKTLVDELRAGGEVTQIIVGPCWVSVRFRLAAPLYGDDRCTSAAPDWLELM